MGKRAGKIVVIPSQPNKENGSYFRYFRPEKWAKRRADRDYNLKSTLDLEKKLKEFKSCREPEPFVIKCLESHIIDDLTCDSSAISSVVIPRRKIREILGGLEIGYADPDYVRELFEHRRAAEITFSAAKRGDPLTEEFIKELHRIIITDMYPGGGQYRSKRVMIQGCPKEPAKPEDIEPRLQKLLASELVHDKSIPIWHRVERFHLEFEDIHPFDDGNGRVGFLLMVYQLISEGYPPAVILYSDYVEYFYAFDVYYRCDNEIPMRNFFTHIIERGVDNYLEVYRRYNDNLMAMKRLNRRKNRKIAGR